MQTYEFYAIPKNGVIPIPEQLKDKITSGVKVILREEGPCDAPALKTAARRKSDLLLPPTADTVNWRFSREEANER